MDEVGMGRGGGCAQRLVLLAALLWFGVVPMASPALIDAVMGDLVSTRAAEGIAVLVAGIGLVVPFGGLLSLVRRRGAGRDVTAVAGALAIASGYVVLDAGVRTGLPQRAFLVPLRSRYAVAALRLAILVPYATLAAWLAARLTGASGRPMRDWLGLRRPAWSTYWLALGAAALVTVPWPLTGALGDSLDSLAVTVQMLSSILPQVLIFWGVIFVLLTRSLAQTEAAALLTMLITVLSALGHALPDGDLAVLNESLSLWPVALLLTEMRARARGIVPLLPLALAYELAPALFVDPRDALAIGIPEPQHGLSYWIVALVAIVVAVTLTLGRRAFDRRRDREAPQGRRRRPGARAATVLLALAAWGAWAGLYLVEGEPGFFNHGFLIILEEQADLDAASTILNLPARRSAVYRTLVETAEASQGPIRGELDDLGVAYRPYYLINMVRVDGHRWLMRRFADRPGVAEVILNPNVRVYPWRIPLPQIEMEAGEGVGGNLEAIHADAAWELGVRGQGIVVGAQDSGYAWEHPALKAQYRGWDGEVADHDYNWHDAWDDTREPFDDGSHGTHTLGTVLGDDGGDNRIGVAPEATWIGCRNMRRGFGNPASYVECMAFLLAPYPLGGDPFQDGDVTLSADVINNSWGCPRWEGCFKETLRPAVEALRAAGIMMAVSAGNDGPACRTAMTPPASYDASFSVGATTDQGEVVGFSSRGPADGLIKPDIAAPGRSVRSSVPGGGYGVAAGTSMAAPHVAGTVALVWSADTRLIGDIDATEALLCRTAAPKPVTQACSAVTVPEGPLAALSNPPACTCGGVSGVPNNVYGCGVVDAGAAVSAVLED